MKNFISHTKNTFLLFCLLSGSLSAQNWTGNINTDWNNSGNWTGWPLGGDDIVIDPANYTGAAASPVIGASSVFTPGEILIQNGAQLTVNANLSANDRIEILGTGTTVTINAGTLHAAGSGSNGRFIVGEAAAIHMNGGTLTANQRVIVELGASFTLNNGTVNTDELAIGDGVLATSSLFDMYNGQVNINGLGFENEAGLFYPTFRMAGGVLDVDGDVSWLGVTPGAGTPRFIMTGGTATVAGNITNDPASTVDLYMNIAGNADFNFDGALISLVHNTDSIKQSGTSVIILSNTHNWTSAGAFYAAAGTVLFNGNTSMDGTGNYTFYDATIVVGKTLSHLTPSTVRVNGNFTNHGTYNANMHPILFGGTTPQVISGTSITAFHLLLLNNAAGLTLNQSASITGNLLLSNGKLNTSLTHLLTVTDNASASQGSAASYVNGPMRKLGDDTFVFPIGKNSRWRRLRMSAPPAITSEFTAEYFDNSYSSTSPVSSPLTAVTGIEYWTLQRANPADDVDLRLYWEDASASAITNCSDLSMAYWSGTSWENILSTAAGTCTGSGSGSIQSTAVVGNATAYTFGFYDGVTVQDFSLCAGETVTVGPNTYNTSGTYIDVLTSSTMTDSVVITNLFIAQPVTATQSGILLTADVAGADAYQWLDCNNSYLPVGGETGETFTATSNGTYAVSITQGGCTDTSDCYTINSVSVGENMLSETVKVYPNPSNGMVNITLHGNTNGRYTLTDLSGKMLVTGDLLQQHTTLDWTVQAKGIYVLHILCNGTATITRLVKY